MNISLVPSMKGVQGTIAKEFSGVGSVADAAGADGGRRFGGKFGSAMKGVVGPAVALLGVAAVGGFLKGAIAEAREAQKVGALTESIIKSTGGAANITAKQIGSLSTSLSNKTGVDDEAIQTGANLLLTFKNVRNEAGKGNKVFNDATAAAVDLSAAGFGSVESASKTLGKALNDPVKGIAALGRAGVTFTDQQKEQIKTLVESGDVLGAQKIILGEVQSQVGGAAAASATAGEKLAVAFGNFKESIGTALLPVLDKVMNFITVTVLPGLLALGPKIGAAVAFIKSLFSGFSASSDGASSKFAQFRTTVAAVWASVQMIFTSAISIVSSLWSMFGSTITTYATNTFTNLMTIIRGAFQIIQGIFQVFSALLKGDWQGVWDGIKLILSGAWAVIQGLVDQGWNAVKTIFSLAGTAIKAIFSGIWDGIQALASKGIESLVAAVRAVPGKLLALLSKFKDAGKQLIEGFISGLSKAGGIAADFAGTIWKAVKDVINSGIDRLNSLLEFSIPVPGFKDISVNAPNIGHLAMGTNNWRGGPTWVGERGPEILNLPRGSQVIPNHKIDAGGSSESPSLDGLTVTIVDGGHMANTFQGIVNARSSRVVAR